MKLIFCIKSFIIYSVLLFPLTLNVYAGPMSTAVTDYGEEAEGETYKTNTSELSKETGDILATDQDNNQRLKKKIYLELLSDGVIDDTLIESQYTKKRKPKEITAENFVQELKSGLDKGINKLTNKIDNLTGGNGNFDALLGDDLVEIEDYESLEPVTINRNRIDLKQKATNLEGSFSNDIEIRTNYSSRNSLQERAPSIKNDFKESPTAGINREYDERFLWGAIASIILFLFYKLFKLLLRK